MTTGAYTILIEAEGYIPVKKNITVENDLKKLDFSADIHDFLLIREEVQSDEIAKGILCKLIEINGWPLEVTSVHCPKF